MEDANPRKDLSQGDPAGTDKNRRGKTLGWINDFKSNTLTRIQKFESQLEMVTRERNKLAIDLKNANAQLAELREGRKKLLDEVNGLKGALQGVKSEFKYSEEEKADAFEQIKSLQGQITSLDEQRRSLESELATTKDTLLNTMEAQEDLKGKIRFLEDKIAWNDKSHQDDLNKLKVAESRLHDLIGA